MQDVILKVAKFVCGESELRLEALIKRGKTQSVV
jgi:hypothetical protein